MFQEDSTNISYSHEAPAPYYCPITTELMKDPVSAEDGHTYERAAITEWLTNKDTSPVTGVKFTSKNLTPNYALKHLIELYKREHRQLPAAANQPNAPLAPLNQQQEMNAEVDRLIEQYHGNMANNKCDKALDNIQAALVQQPNNVNFLQFRGDAYCSLNQGQSALDDYMAALRIQPNLAQDTIFYRLGGMLIVHLIKANLH